MRPPQYALSKQWVSDINRVLRDSPFGCLFYIAGARGLLFAAGSTVCKYAGVPHEFALAFAVTRPLKKVRLPLDLGGAVCLAKMVPRLKEIEMSRVISPGASTEETEKVQNKFAERYPRAAAMWKTSADLVDHYGAAYFIARDMVGLSIMFVVSMLLSVDPLSITSTIISASGVSPETASTFSAMAGGACLSTCSTPFLMFSLPYSVTRISSYFDIDKKLRDYQEKKNQ
eukprot:TRINITY_DN67586_c0_g1_i1.p1 TRINITY_DN67586_c0_g1~~TRINITY_DN67586_c0_g1_i1.p1  ORF type:complete len:229 (+),score=40.06 TRINITY_DN67586_c0_g1_i1:44-730(+)